MERRQAADGQAYTADVKLRTDTAESAAREAEARYTNVVNQEKQMEQQHNQEKVMLEAQAVYEQQQMVLAAQRDLSQAKAKTEMECE